MSDAIEAAIRGLRGQEPPGGFAPADAVRRRGTRRAYRQFVAVGVAVFVVAGGTAAFVAQETGQRTAHPAGSAAPSVPPATTPSVSAPARTTPPVGVTPAMFLTAADLGPGNWVIGQSGDVRAEFWPWQEICTPYRRADYPSLAQRVRMDWRDMARTDLDGPTRFQTVEQYQPGVGPGNLDDVRDRLRECAGLQSPTDGGLPLRWTVVASGFAGDDAVLAKKEVFQDGGPTKVYYTVAVRVGDLVSTVLLLDAGASESTARDLATRVAARLG